MFALADRVIGNPTIATFAAFGSFAMLLLVDFTGPMRERLQAQVTLAAVSAVFITVATLASRSTWLAAATMAVVAFGVLFAGIVSSTLAGATTALLLAFILPVSLPGTVSSIPDRLAGWGLASAAGLLAIALLWPAPTRNPLRAAAIDACGALAARLRAEVAFVRGGRSKELEPEHDAAVDRSDRAVQRLEDVFFATPYRPTGLSTAARATVRLVDEVRWLNSIIVQAAARARMAFDRRAGNVKSAAALVLECGGQLLGATDGSAERLHVAQAALRDDLVELERSATLRLPFGGEMRSGSVAVEPRAGEAISALDPSFRAQELSFVVLQVVANVELTAAAERRNWLAKVLGRPPAGIGGRLSAAQERAGAHAERHSLWLRNSIRGAVGLGLAVLVAKLTGVQHAFWVAFGTLSVLRSSALGTGQNVVRSLIGTTAGFIVGAALVVAIGTNTTLLWLLLPFAVLLAGLAPAAVSFAAGQAAFTLTLLILFNLLAPAGWKIGLVRIEDVALGSAVSLAVGLLLWPRGAAAALELALSDAYNACAAYLARAVEFGMGRCDSSGSGPPPPTDEAIAAAAASRRLDSTFRGYLAERGAKPVPLADVTTLVTSIAGLRLAGDAVLDLWQGAGAGDGDRSGARRELLASARMMTEWYAAFAASLLGRAAVPEPLTHDGESDTRLIAAVSDDLLNDEGTATATAIRMIWTADHLDAARRLQGSLVGPARAVGVHRRPLFEARVQPAIA
jgi:uncharacterized membrane protein YccC